ncbi:hypothetical protein [Mucilaginibacter sp. PAMB04168]|uniref:hypothetical protein n=1 Tax=Mucilaginibacter sp. PAMB04168 TaxID=3138567 RepID=UPI0031F64FC2
MEYKLQTKLAYVYGFSILLNIVPFILDGSISSKELPSMFTIIIVGCAITSAIYRGSSTIKWLLLFFSAFTLLPLVWMPEVFNLAFKNITLFVRMLCFVTTAGIQLTTTVILFAIADKRLIKSSNSK